MARSEGKSVAGCFLPLLKFRVPSVYWIDRICPPRDHPLRSRARSSHWFMHSSSWTARWNVLNRPSNWRFRKRFTSAILIHASVWTELSRVSDRLYFRFPVLWNKGRTKYCYRYNVVCSNSVVFSEQILWHWWFRLNDKPFIKVGQWLFLGDRSLIAIGP